MESTETSHPSYRCLCYFTNNIFIRDYNVHVSYATDRQFWEDYSTVLLQKGCDTEAKRQQLISQITTEVERRRNVGKESVQRKEAIQRLYKPLHPQLYTLEESYLDPVFVDLVTYSRQVEATPEGVLTRISCEPGERVYSLPVFTPVFCQRFVELLRHFEQSPCPKGRPNTMNQYGVLLDELGFDEGLLSPLRENYLQPISRLLFPDCGGGALDSHKAFVVQYKLSEDLDLSYHYDNAEVTLNVSLGADFKGGDLYFGPMKGVENESETLEFSVCKHSPGRGILHRGQHKHGAQPIRAGERYNLIMWMRCSGLRNELCPMCDLRPDLVEVEGPGDGFTVPQGGRDNQDTVQVCGVT